MVVRQTVKNRELIRRIMILSHDIGYELSVEDVAEKSMEIQKYLREDDGNNQTITLTYTLFYMREVLEEQYEKRHGKN
jgi:hypothetical protein